MTVETATYISDLNATYPAATDGKVEGDDHIRLVKTTVKATFPNVAGAVTPTHTELNYVDGVTSAIQTQIDAKAATAALAATTGAELVGAIQTGTGATARTVQSKLRDAVNVKDFGATGDGVADDTAEIQAAIDSVSSTGGVVEFGIGDFLISSAITRPANVYLIGRGPYATRIRSTHNGAIISATGSSGSVINRGGVSHMTLTGPGLANTSTVGVSESWTNRSIIENVIVHGCYIGFYASNVWQCQWVNLQPNGSGADQNAIGFYLAEVDPANQNNAVMASGCTAQGVSLYGWRIINGNGSKFVNCEGLNGTHGFYICDPTTGTESCRWLHFTNCLADTNSGHNWRFERGSATALTQIQLSNCWGGTSTGGHNFYFGGASQLVASNLMGVSANKSGIALVSSSRVAISGGGLFSFDGAAAANPGILLENSSLCSIGGALQTYSTSGTAKAVVETGTSDNNIVIGNVLAGGCTKLGTNSRIFRNQGAAGERRGSAQITAAATTVTVTHGVDGSPSIDEVRVTPRTTLGTANKFWVSGMTSTQFVINVDAAPGATITFNWGIDPVYQ